MLEPSEARKTIEAWRLDPEPAHRGVLRLCGAPPRGINLVDLDLDWLGLKALLAINSSTPSIGRADTIAVRVEWKPECASDGAVAAGPFISRGAAYQWMRYAEPHNVIIGQPPRWSANSLDVRAPRLECGRTWL
jgi:hypothetical protein